MSRSIELDPVERVAAGAIGEPGSRVFLVQAQGGGEHITILAEKQQVEALGQAILQLFTAVPEDTDDAALHDVELEEPLDPEWRAGDISLEYDDISDRVVIVVTEAALPDDVAAAATARLVLTRGQALALAEHALESVAAGRPRCQLCGNPIELDGEHMCPTMNGHRSMQD